jgi:hypothetical protein
MRALHPAALRGVADHGWLKSRHTFSFGAWHDPRFMGFGVLRVINEDVVLPAMGFGTHPHRDMEIISYVVSGKLGHKDSTGGGGVIRAGEVQVMTAGTGVTHSEMNGSATEPVHFLQIWILPAKAGAKPRYDQADFGQKPGVVRVVSPDGADGSLAIGQDATLDRVLLTAGDTIDLKTTRRRGWLQVVRGRVDAGGLIAGPGDAVVTVDEPTLPVSVQEDVEALWFDLP